MTNQLNDDQITDSELDKIRDNGLKENNALRVHRYLRANERSRSRRLPRWIWELLQNALDASTAHDDSLTVKIEYSPEELVFLHNGSSFKAKQIFNLIYHGSTKADEEEAIGEYGSGFLTTHLLSPEIKVSGQFNNKQWFDFRLTRKSDSPDALLDLMDEAWENFKESLSTPDQSIPDSFTTQFIYPIIGAEAEEAVEKGIETLEQCAPYVVAFNPKFSRIDITNHSEMLCFQVPERTPLDTSTPQQISVTESKNEELRDRKYLLTQGEFIHGEKEIPVAIAVELNSDGSVCQSVKKIPRLFKAVPLVGTESFSFPAVINSLGFEPSEDRDDVYIGQGNNEANTKNQTVIEKSCALLVHLLQYAASKGWYHVPQWAEVPTIQHPTEETRKWLRTCIREKFIEEIRETPVVLNETGGPITPKMASLPLAESDIGVEIFWKLMNDWQEYRDKLPRQNEAAGWCNVIKSWADVYQDEPMSLFNEVTGGRKLALFIQESTREDDNHCGRIETLQNLLREDISAVEWLNRLHDFFNENGLREAVREYYIVIDQSGFLDKLSALHRDPGIDKELKEIAETLDWSIRQKLRDIRLTSLSEEGGCGDMSQDEVVDTLRQKLRDRADENPDDDFKEASKQLFGWIVNKEKWNLLQGFPVFTEDNKSNSSSVCYLPSAHTSRPLLAPLRAWAEDLEPFKDLFPPERILADAFFEVVVKPDAWKELDNRHLIKSEKIIIDDKSDDLKLFSPEVYEDEDDKKIHEIDMPFWTTDVLEWNEIMRNARSNRDNSYLFWRFLTEYIIKKDNLGLEEKSVKCTSCDKYHKYYPAAWLRIVRSNKWIRLGDPHFRADAPSLANLLQNKWELRLLENPGVRNLLQAMSVDPAALKRLFISDEVINVATTLYDSPQLVQHIQDNENLSQDIEKILEATGGDLSRVVEDVEEEKEQQDRMDVNRDFGKRVEKRVRQLLDQNLKPKGFSVTRKYTGSDLEILPETFDISTQEIIQNEKKWLVEIKGTRGQSVKMSFEQTKNALDKREEFLLCVVPIPEDTQPDFDTVKENILFIKNIHRKLGDRVAKLCNSIDIQKEVTDKTPDDTSPGIVLDFEKGKAGIRVQESVWEDEGFPLTELAEHLK